MIHQLADLLAGLASGWEGLTELVMAAPSLPQVRHLLAADGVPHVEKLLTFICSYRAEASDLVLPSKLLGILASGRPVVASSPAGSELAGLADQAGVCVRPGDARAFAAAIRELVASPERRVDAGRRARLLVEERFGMEAVLSRFEQQLRDLASQADTRAGVR